MLRLQHLAYDATIEIVRKKVSAEVDRRNLLIYLIFLPKELQNIRWWQF